ncbi:MAG: acyltransferase [Gammaproteobacteria bacterium]|nr:acyltransferase [Gammaproteobacteria bacterium]
MGFLKTTFKILRLVYHDLGTVTGRYQVAQAVLKDIPGRYGQALRIACYRNYFGSAGEGIVIHLDARIRNIQNINIGDRSRIGECVMLQAGGGLDIGNDVLIGPGAKIWSINHGFADTAEAIQNQGYDFKKVTLGDGCWVGANAFIMPGTTLGEGCVVSAGAVVSAKNYPPFKIIGGNPARIIGTRQ